MPHAGRTDSSCGRILAKLSPLWRVYPVQANALTVYLDGVAIDNGRMTNNRPSVERQSRGRQQRQYGRHAERPI